MFFFLNDPATTEIYTLSLHAAFPISARAGLALQERQHLVVEQAVAGHGVTTADGALAAPVGEPPTRLLDDRQQSGAVPHAHPAVDNNVGEPVPATRHWVLTVC